MTTIIKNGHLVERYGFGDKSNNFIADGDLFILFVDVKNSDLIHCYKVDDMCFTTAQSTRTDWAQVLDTDKRFGYRTVVPGKD